MKCVATCCSKAWWSSAPENLAPQCGHVRAPTDAGLLELLTRLSWLDNMPIRSLPPPSNPRSPPASSKWDLRCVRNDSKSGKAALHWLQRRVPTCSYWLTCWQIKIKRNYNLNFKKYVHLQSLENAWSVWNKIAQLVKWFCKKWATGPPWAEFFFITTSTSALGTM